MNQDQRRLVAALKIRQEQLSAQMEGEPVKYEVTMSSHMRDVMTVLAVLENKPNAAELLKNMPREEDRPQTMLGYVVGIAGKSSQEIKRMSKD